MDLCVPYTIMKYLMTRFRFEKDQTLLLKNPSEVKTDHVFKPFLKENTLDADKIYQQFMLTIHHVLEDYEIPLECPLSREHLQLKKTIVCDKCVDLNTIPPRFVRCTCQDGKNSPSLASSKIGAVLHLVWSDVIVREEKLVDFKMDVDFVCSMVPLVDEPDKHSAQRKRADYLTEFNPPGRKIIFI